MSSTLEQPTTTTGELTHPGPSPASVLIDRLPESWKLSQATAGLSALLALYFLFVNYQPVTHLEVWDHLAFGRLIATNRALPQTEPFLPLMRGIPTADTSWLGQTVAYLAYNRWGAAALQFLNGLGVAGCFVALAWFGCRQLRSAPWTLAGMAMLFILDWYQFTILRPQTAGLFCFVLLVTASTARRVQFRDWLLVPALFALWANLHGSFLAGLAWLACLSVGRAIDLWRRTGHVMAFRNDAPFRRLVMLTELAAVATLLNPFGTGIYRQLLEYFQNSNLRSLLEWDPLQIRTGPGSAAAVAALALAVVYRLTPRRISSSEILAHLAFGGAALWSSMFLPWWSVIAAVSFMRHGAAITRLRSPAAETEPQRAGKWSVITVAVVWIAFGFTPLGSTLLHGRQIEPKKSLSPLAPVELADYLEKHPISGQVFNSMELGDYLLWAGPRDLKLFMTSHVELAPREVWKAYQTIVNAGAGWAEQLDRYSVNAVVVDKLEHEALIKEIKFDPNWKRDYEDGIAVIYLRKKPL